MYGIFKTLLCIKVQPSILNLIRALTVNLFLIMWSDIKYDTELIKFKIQNEILFQEMYLGIGLSTLTVNYLFQKCRHLFRNVGLYFTEPSHPDGLRSQGDFIGYSGHVIYFRSGFRRRRLLRLLFQTSASFFSKIRQDVRLEKSSFRIGLQVLHKVQFISFYLLIQLQL